MGGTRGPKMTLTTQLVLYTLLEAPEREWYGLELAREAGVATGTLHPILARLENLGWLASRWEEIDTHEEGRPRRRYYRLEPNAKAHVLAALHRSAASAKALGRLRPGAVGGES